MVCPSCGGTNKVIGSKKGHKSIHRRRMCDKCHYIFYTEEHEVDSSVEYDELMTQYEKGRKRNNDRDRND